MSSQGSHKVQSLAPLEFLVYIDDLGTVFIFINITRKFADVHKLAVLMMLQHCNLVWINLLFGRTCGECSLILPSAKLCILLDQTHLTHTLLSFDQEKDIEIIIHKTKKPTTQCASSALNANIVLSGMIFLLELKMRALLSVLNKDMMNTSFKLN